MTDHLRRSDMLNSAASVSQYPARSAERANAVRVQFSGLSSGAQWPSRWLKTKPDSKARVPINDKARFTTKDSSAQGTSQNVSKESKSDESVWWKSRWTAVGGVATVASALGLQWGAKNFRPGWLKSKTAPVESSVVQQLKNLAWDYRFPLLGAGVSIGGTSVWGYRWLSKTLENAVKPEAISAPLAKYLNQKQRKDTVLKVIPAIAGLANGFLGYRFYTSTVDKVSDSVSKLTESSTAQNIGNAVVRSPIPTAGWSE